MSVSGNLPDQNVEILHCFRARAQRYDLLAGKLSIRPSSNARYGYFHFKFNSKGGLVHVRGAENWHVAHAVTYFFNLGNYRLSLH